jgi:uncharacterized membrane protein YhaH (DUF805 family)
MEYITAALSQYADFNGRTKRRNYWMFFLFYTVFYILVTIVDTFLTGGVLTSIYVLVFLIPTLSIAARRLHDIGRTGWWQLIGLIPIVGWIVVIVFLAQPSQGDNIYGAAPEVDLLV